MKAVNDITIKDFNDLAKNTLPTMYVNGYTGLYENPKTMLAHL